jgi:ABC-type antimicrobial peptide transport system permease subunit
VVGVLIGTTTVILVASIIAGLDNRLVEAAEQFGTRTLWIYKLQLGFPHRLTREERMRKPLSYEDAMAIRDQCPAVEAVSVMLFRELGMFGLPPSNAKYKGREMINAQFSGATPDHIRLINTSLQDGRFFSDADDLHHRNVVVLGIGVVTMLFENEDPIGKAITVDGHNFEVIGTFAKFKGFLSDNPDDRTVMIPYSAYKKLYPNAKDNFISVLAYMGRVDQAIDEITGVLRRRRHVKSSDPDNFGIASADSVINQFHQIIGTVALAMVVISSIGLLVGGIGVMNIMLVSVTERTREIGVRKAIGARRSDITLQFLLEAITLTTAGGAAGIVVGWSMSFLIRTLVPSLPSTVPVWSILIGVLVSISVGLFFGMWPALKASRIDPIVALRYE